MNFMLFGPAVSQLRHQTFSTAAIKSMDIQRDPQVAVPKVKGLRFRTIVHYLDCSIDPFACFKAWHIVRNSISLCLADVSQ